MDKALARFIAKVAKTDAGCWSWTAAKDADGYGVFFLEGKNPRAHRAALTLQGQTIPEGMVVDHTCRNRACVNPDHLRVVDRRTNVHENSEAPGYLNSLKTHCSRGHEFSGDNLILRPSGRRGCRTCETARLRQYRQNQKEAQR